MRDDRRGREEIKTQSLLNYSTDDSFRQNLSPIAKKACDIVAKIRDEEQKQFWKPELEEQIAVAENATIHPGMMFTHAKGIMEKTKLWQIVRKLPKGALLHAHLDAIVDFDYLFDVLLNTPGIHISSSTGSLATESARSDGLVQFKFFKSEQGSDSNIWSEDYRPDTFVLLSKAADVYPDTGKAGFISWLKSRCTISETDSVEQHHGVDHIWERFQTCFVIIGTIIHYEPIFRAFLQRMMNLFYADGVYWAEIR